MANVGERERTQAAHVEYEDAKVALENHLDERAYSFL